MNAPARLTENLFSVASTGAKAHDLCACVSNDPYHIPMIVYRNSVIFLRMHGDA
jgi:hypothetical protein